jgi:hypothetical protein
MRILYYLFTNKAGHRLKFISHITSRYRSQFKTNAPIKTKFNEGHTNSEQSSKNESLLFELTIKEVRKASSWIL